MAAALTTPAAILASFLQLLPRVAASSSPPDTLPYTPTTILVPTSNASVVYLFSPTDTGQIQFLALNISSSLSSSARSITTLLEAVPFLGDNGQENTASAFVPVLRSDGSIVVYAGDCSSASTNSPSVWTYTPQGTAIASQWTSRTITHSSSSQSGPWFLGGSTAFSNQIAPTVSNSTIYLYGGMCPSSESSASSTVTAAAAGASSVDASDWQVHAAYSNQMLKLVPSGGTYAPSIVSSKGPPIAEAGFSLTSLPASQLNRSGTITQQMNSVVLGGHTKTAFVNMSTAAIWSLPEEAWSFVSIASPYSSGNTELAVVKKAANSVSAPDSRSGHTAVLSEDGSSLVVLGGWVGDVGQAADPQLAILEMDTDYSQWKWSIPSVQPSGTGLFGHGAALLPGNVMMVYGGYNISSGSTAKRLIRRQSDTPDGSLMFFNMTSLSWSEDYTNPTSVALSSPAAAPTASSSSTSSSKIGLGVGLGLGIPLAILILVLVVRSCRRRMRRRHRRDKAVSALAQDHQQFLQDSDMAEVANGAGLPVHWNSRDAAGSGFYTGGHDPYSLGRRSLGFESLHGAQSSHAFPANHSPTSSGENDLSTPGATYASFRKPARNVARGLYQPTTINDYESLLAAGAAGAAAGSGASRIHPIYETEEEEDDYGAGKGKNSRAPTLGTADSTDRSISPETEELTDPFLTPSNRSIAGGLGGAGRPSHSGAFGPNTVNFNPFVRNSPSPGAGTAAPHIPRSAGLGEVDLTEAGTEITTGKHDTAAGQDRDVQEWVSGLDIEDLLFSPPLPGAVAAVAASVSPAPGATGHASAAQQRQQLGKAASINASRHLSLRSKASSSGSPTRNTFSGAGPVTAASTTAGAMAGMWGGGDDEARTGSNLSDRSAFSFLSRTGSVRSFRMGGGSFAPGGSAVVDPKVPSTDSSSESFNTAPSFHYMRNEGPSLLFGKGHRNGSSSGGSFGDSSGGGSLYRGMRGAPPQHRSQGHGQGSNEYGGAASVMTASFQAPDTDRHQSVNNGEDESNTAPGSPSKTKGRRTWVGSIMRMFSSGSPGNISGNSNTSVNDAAVTSSMGTGIEQGADYRDMAHATLLRRKQGRSDWEADDLREEESTAVGALRSGGRTASMGSTHGRSLSGGGHGPGASTQGGLATSGIAASGSIAAGRRDGSGKSDEWDVEKAVQSRVVQVMFTVPRDRQLRVVNAEVEKDEEEAYSASSKPVMGVHPFDDGDDDGHGRDLEKANDEQLGGLSAPPPPPVLQRPHQSYRSISPYATAMKADTIRDADTANQQYGILPPEAVFPVDPEFLEQHGRNLKRLQKALDNTDRYLSDKSLQPWLQDSDDDDVATFGGEEVHEDKAEAVPMNKGRVVDVGSPEMGSRSLPMPDTAKADDRQGMATAAAMATKLTSEAPLRAEDVVPAVQTPTETPVASPARTLVRTPVRTSAKTPAKTPVKTPSKAPSAESMSTNPSTLTPRRSGRRGTLGGETLLGSPAASQAASTIRKPPGFVLDMVDRIETDSAKSEGS